ncbi:HAMP domain-containing sensor histidine kinase [Desulfobotulus sp.]|uniref:sensor histidine kinase n=1 Tax=Desulfobotulus sp. TaxID=1940337 RepID=UPI002A365D5F|nr:HAMP domain-containing sensor histidine kinase [Desulfobotulus sp.]MDY0161687.1 HAMP domain-containing sensor histidine kinase [Desulfobotulus sp.]
MRLRRSLQNTMLVMLVSVTALGISFYLYIRWFMEVKTGLQDLARTLNLDGDRVMAPETFSVVFTLSVLVGLILVGLSVIYLYYRKAMSLYRMQRRFIRSFTHELKTPVASIRLYLDTFLKHELPREDSLRYLGYMKLDTERLSDQIQRILNLARIEGGMSPLALENLDLGEKILAIHREHPRFEALELHIRTSEEGFFHHVDPDLFAMLVTNLMENALRYNESVRPCMEVRLEKVKKHTILRFSDNGFGLEKKDLKRIFKRFYRVDPQGRAPGTGLGLHLVDHVARMHKGRIRAESEGLGKGSTFILTLPIRYGGKNEKADSAHRG